MALPSNLEQYMLELVNEARLNPIANAARYITSYSPLASSDPDISNAISFFGVNGAALLAAYQALTPTQPLAWNSNIHDASALHNTAMITADAQEHQLPGEPGLGTRLTNAGYTGWNSAGENIYAYSDSVIYGHAGFMVDWGPGPDGMQAGAGHRVNIMSSGFREVGIAIVGESNPATAVGPLVITEDFGRRNSGPAVFILGAAYTDSDANRFYTPGEGLGTLVLSTTSASTTSAASGGYTLGLAAGAQTLTFSGAGLSAPVTATGTFAAGTNAKIDIVNGNTLLSSTSVTVNGPVSRIEGLGLTGLSLTGGNGGQTIVGTAGADTLSGLGDGDVLIGGLGGDTLAGGTGFDFAIYASSAAGVTVDLMNSAANAGGDAQGDQLSGIEGLNGSIHADTLRGDDAFNSIYGNSGNDTIEGRGNADALFGNDGTDSLNGGLGGDHIDGGTGFDFAVYAGSAAGVTVDLMNNAANAGGDAAGDQLFFVEGLIGSTHGDTLRGNDDFNSIYGHTGDDTLEGRGGNDALFGNDGTDFLAGGVGGDHLDGGTGYDFVTYAGATSGVRADLLAPAANTGEAAGDTYNAVDGMIGTSFDDILLGSDGVNAIYGGAGGDTIFGRDGNDSLLGNSGNDVLVGGRGNDTLFGSSTDFAALDNDGFVYEGPGYGQDVIYGFGANAGANHDIISFSTSIFSSFSAVLAASQQMGTDTVIFSGADRIQLVHVSVAQLSADDFNFF
ncbi:MAG TPA: hypothetical protein PK264_20955 [Hyphomicrobiaceae bacterium]|nr:hypothetical protein [Hyphomicrobiaceae bacterium]